MRDGEEHRLGPIVRVVGIRVASQDLGPRRCLLVMRLLGLLLLGLLAVLRRVMRLLLLLISGVLPLLVVFLLLMLQAHRLLEPVPTEANRVICRHLLSTTQLVLPNGYARATVGSQPPSLAFMAHGLAVVVASAMVLVLALPVLPAQLAELPGLLRLLLGAVRALEALDEDAAKPADGASAVPLGLITEGLCAGLLRVRDMLGGVAENVQVRGRSSRTPLQEAGTGTVGRACDAHEPYQRRSHSDEAAA
mmetsp:Transcript_60392/g.153168  ORF Transcript_60392/g.153168 Transcript_60392/m.153168 type:complete len:249 (-) Transcript_60392:223-969(-)